MEEEKKESRIVVLKNKYLYTGSQSTFFLTRSGEVFCFGSNIQGELGLGHEDKVDTPIKISLPENERVKAISSHGQVTYICTEGGKVYSFGVNFRGNLCHGDMPDKVQVNKPTRVVEFTKNRVVDVSAGIHHAFLVCQTEEGENEIYGVGYNYNGQLGISTSGNSAHQFIPQKVTHFSDRYKLRESDIDLYPGGWHSCFIHRPTGFMYSCGFNRDGACGFIKRQQSTVPFICNLKRPSLKFVSASTAGVHSLFLDEDGKVYSCGLNSNGQLGISNDKSMQVFKPERIRGVLDDQVIVGVFSGYSTSFFVNQHGEVFSCGRNGHHQLGHSSEADVFFPKKIEFEFSSPVVEVASAHTFTIFKCKNGDFFGCGNNGENQLFGPEKNEKVVKKIVKLFNISEYESGNQDLRERVEFLRSQFDSPGGKDANFNIELVLTSQAYKFVFPKILLLL